MYPGTVTIRTDPEIRGRLRTDNRIVAVDDAAVSTDDGGWTVTRVNTSSGGHSSGSTLFPGTGQGVVIAYPGTGFTPAPVFEVQHRDADSLVLKLNTPGKYEIRYNVTITPDGGTPVVYENLRTITVKADPYIEGEGGAVVGETRTYYLRNRISGSTQWSVQNTGALQFYNGVPAYKIISSTDNECTIAYFKSGNYTVKAEGLGSGKSAAYNVAISGQGAQIARFYTYEKTTNKYDKWLSADFMSPLSDDGQRKLVGAVSGGGLFACTDVETSFIPLQIIQAVWI